jgi:sensor c-di-GMP phosphodiesterase-like protein
MAAAGSGFHVGQQREGEEKTEARALQRMGCDIAQGYLFSQPLPSEQLGALLRRRLSRKSAAA